MVVANMEAEQNKERVLQLIKDKDKIEADLRALREILDSNHVGMNDPLVDNDGYPRQDIDVYQVRHARNRIIYLQNDHKALMKKIEEGLYEFHSYMRGQTDDSIPAATSSLQETILLDPFLRVNLVLPGSPAEIAGIQIEDLILEFGSIDAQNFKSLKDIADVVEHSRYKSVIVKIKRGINTTTLSLIPRPWSGKGLLGCNVVPVESVER
ncbi:26S proteasome non-ATPase regulatory subunit 9 [Cephus cinctus]|uniref:26S proteasome non-ATPase regulatory subunit 9 n=1 Tax=Cephus cinctus TaxID=211228 RepID=A0AAJ7BGR8_CEPCN|nr:26S proteasome non-ATPase regulatory subunit 9 [Cephus cinctus]XP_015584999.1 26S proteasome non-ATPase regulatory subunit 9 [Cephus cinctus]